jgi:hypothetical protein
MNLDRAPGLCRDAARAIACAFADGYEFDNMERLAFGSVVP